MKTDVFKQINKTMLQKKRRMSCYIIRSDQDLGCAYPMIVGIQFINMSMSVPRIWNLESSEMQVSLWKYILVKGN